MKYFAFLVLVLILGCQDAKKSPPEVEKVAQTEDDIMDKEAFIFRPNIKGLELSGSNLHTESGVSIAEDLKIIEESSKKVVDDFPLLDWGPVSFKTENETLKVMPLPELEMSYSVDAKNKVSRIAKCEFKTPVDQQRYDQLLASARSVKPDWEGVFFGLSRLATQGHKLSYDFFMNPNEEAKKFLKKSDGAASTDTIYRVLNFMKKNGCKW